MSLGDAVAVALVAVARVDVCRRLRVTVRRRLGELYVDLRLGFEAVAILEFEATHATTKFQIVFSIGCEDDNTEDDIRGHNSEDGNNEDDTGTL